MEQLIAVVVETTKVLLLIQHYSMVTGYYYCVNASWKANEFGSFTFW